MQLWNVCFIWLLLKFEFWTFELKVYVFHLINFGIKIRTLKFEFWCLKSEGLEIPNCVKLAIAQCGNFEMFVSSDCRWSLNFELLNWRFMYFIWSTLASKFELWSLKSEGLEIPNDEKFAIAKCGNFEMCVSSDCRQSLYFKFWTLNFWIMTFRNTWVCADL